MTIVLVTVIAVSWTCLLTGAGTGMRPHEMAAALPDYSGMAVMLMSPATWTTAYALLMFSMWWLMMIAMMLPSAAPMVLAHAAITHRGLAQADSTGSGDASRGVLPATSAFLAGYLVMWAVFSLFAVVAQWLLERSALLSSMMTSSSRMFGCVLLLAAGLWQFTPLKTACLKHCRSPAGFLAGHWQPGVGGAFRMGSLHGMFCLGCCWILMALLFYGGVMNLVWIIGLAFFVLAEKLIPAGIVFGKVTGLLLIAWGAWVGFSVT